MFLTMTQPDSTNMIHISSNQTKAAWNIGYITPSKIIPIFLFYIFSTFPFSLHPSVQWSNPVNF